MLLDHAKNTHLKEELPIIMYLQALRRKQQQLSSSRRTEPYTANPADHSTQARSWNFSPGMTAARILTLAILWPMQRFALTMTRSWL
jgi:hypothetical protein